MAEHTNGGRGLTDTQYVILKVLIGGPTYGYDIRKQVETGTAGEMKLSLATLYDSLHRLLEDGLIERDPDTVVDGRTRRTYRVTGVGQQVVTERDRMIARMQRVGPAQPAEGLTPGG